ncbi:MAG: PilZ domain-containing protein [Deltaproteobacteria bacterium]|nr:PilZ domain-containing protein [Deltaproteobacteria bacterium]
MTTKSDKTKKVSKKVSKSESAEAAVASEAAAGKAASASKTTKPAKSDASKPATPRGKSKAAKPSDNNVRFRLLERRRHPRFLLTREQFRENRSGRIFPVYDLSMSGLSIKIDTKYWQPGTIIQGILNLHPDSIELSPRLVGYYGDRAALKLEVASTYSRSVLSRALSPKRLGASLQLVREKLPLADYWFHGVCNTDLLLRLSPTGDIGKVEVFFSNFYWSWTEHSNRFATGVCQSCGREQREDILLAEEPVKLEQIDLCLDSRVDSEKTLWAKGILEAAPLEPRLKELLLKKFETSAQK